MIQPTVSEFATAPAPIVEPEALPELPQPDEPVEEAPAAEAAPEAPIAAELEPLIEPIPEPESEPTPEPVAEAEAPPPPEPEPEFEPTPAPEMEPEPLVAAASEAEPEPQSEPQPEPRPHPVEAAVAAPDVSSTLVAWPTSGQSRGNGTAADAAFEEATSVIPAWQQADGGAASKETVSLQAMPPEEVAVGSAYAALLTFESGPFAGRIVALPNQMVTIGRAPDNDVVVGDPATSGHHGRIEMRSGFFWISDLGSTNGTLVNGEPVIEKQLSDGDMIAIGQNSLRFTLEA